MSNCLLETTATRKNKISLSDYNYQKDIQNRLLMAQLTTEDQEVLEEILYSSLQISVSKLAKNLDLSTEELLPILHKLMPSGLFTLDKDTVIVDKEMRKYFELEIQKFDEDFEPGMEFLQSLLKKAPIHVLPIWYAIPRTSNNIFDSLVEKNLLTPQIFHRYIADLNFGEPVLKQIIQDVYAAEDFVLSSEFLMKKYNITKELFEEYMLHLEFSFVCCIGYRKKEGIWEEIVTPFHEWREYLRFLKKAEISSCLDCHKIKARRPGEFSFVEDVSALLEEIKKNPLSLKQPQILDLEPSYINYMIQKLLLLRLVQASDGKLTLTNAAIEWLNLSIDRKAIYFYRHPLNKIINPGVSESICTEKAMREAEKTIIRALDKDWVCFDEFLHGVLAPLSDESTIVLKRTGKSWKYTLPEYSEEEKRFLRSVVLDWLFEAGLTQPGSLDGKDYFRVTTLGKTLFAR